MTRNETRVSPIARFLKKKKKKNDIASNFPMIPASRQGETNCR